MPCSEDDDSQTGFSISDSTQGMSKAELRKTNKPIMEKKRRARINHCLNELKDLLMDGSDKDPARHSKLEKADILELTVKHLQTLQRQQLAAAIAADPAVLHRFKAGFGDCAVEVRRYLSRLASVPTGLRHRLGNHLNTCISGIDHLNPPTEYPMFPDPLRLEDDRPSAFHSVKTKPTSPPLSPVSYDSACDSSTELETPPRPVHTFPFPTPPSRSASDQDSSPETQKPTVSSTTISPEILKQGQLRNKKYMEPLSIVIDVENYKIGIDASPKRAVDYSVRNKLKRSVNDISGPAPKLIRLETENIVTIKQKYVAERKAPSPEKLSAFERYSERVTFPEKLVISERITLPEKLVIPERVTLPEKMVFPERVTLPEKLVIPERVTLPEKLVVPERVVFPEQSMVTEKVTFPEKLAIPERPAFPEKLVIPERITIPEKKLTIPESIPSVSERLIYEIRPMLVPEIPVTRTVISHTAESLAVPSTSVRKEEKTNTDTRTSSSSPVPEQGTSSSTEMWRPW